jgi:pimeloyl-ACP methyl ester carboxylesterase
MASDAASRIAASTRAGSGNCATSGDSQQSAADCARRELHGDTPRFTAPGAIAHFQNAEVRLDLDVIPFGGAGVAWVAAWSRPLHGVSIDAGWVVAMCDVLPPAVFSRTTGPVKAATPVHLVYGEKDWSRPSDREANRQLLPIADFTQVPNAGHFIALERPDVPANLLTSAS